MKKFNKVFTILVLVFLYIPMIVLAVASFNNGTDPAVMRAMAERVGLTVETREWVDRELTWDGGWTVIRRYERARVCGPWREVPNAD